MRITNNLLLEYIHCTTNAESRGAQSLAAICHSDLTYFDMLYIQKCPSY